MADATDTASRGAGGDQKDVSLGPACLIVVIIGALCLSVGMIAMAAMMTGSQGKRAAYAVREQFIPWIEQSSLPNSDRQNIVSRMNQLSEQMEREELTKRQLGRLVLRLADNPLFQWGVVEQLIAKVNASDGFTNEEKAEFQAGCDRWLRAASDGKLSLQDMEFALQHVSTKDQRSGRLSMREDANDERLRECQRRIATICDKLEISKEPFEKSVTQVFSRMMDDALSEKE